MINSNIRTSTRKNRTCDIFHRFPILFWGQSNWPFPMSRKFTSFSGLVLNQADLPLACTRRSNSRGRRCAAIRRWGASSERLERANPPCSDFLCVPKHQLRCLATCFREGLYSLSVQHGWELFLIKWNTWCNLLKCRNFPQYKWVETRANTCSRKHRSWKRCLRCAANWFWKGCNISNFACSSKVFGKKFCLTFGYCCLPFKFDH